MNYEDFFSLAYDNFFILCSISLLFMVFFFLVFRNFVVSGIIDPFHFIFSFVYSTSYAVIILLYINNKIDFFYMLLIAVYSLFFIFPIYYFRNKKEDRTSRFIYGFFKATHKGKISTTIFVALYIMLLILIIYIKGFSIFTSTNRFQDNAGIGVLARFYDVIWFFVAAMYILYFHERFKAGNALKKFIIVIPFITFFVLNLLVIGSKSELIQYVLFYYLVLSVYGSSSKVGIVKIIFLGTISFFFALIVLYYNFQLANSGDLDSLFTKAFFRLTDRIMSNGDMYYMGLPNEVIEKINVNNVLIDFFTPILSSKFLSSLSGYDVYSFDIGKQILLYHYPTYDVAGGPVDHFDLFGYKHFGVIGGAFFCLTLGMFFVIVRNTLSYVKGDKIMTAIMASFYFKSLSVILKPGILLGFLFDFIFIYMAVCIITTLIIKREK